MSDRIRLDRAMVSRGMLPTRSQAEHFIRLGQVRVNGTILKKPGTQVNNAADIKLLAKEQYVSRAGLKLASVARLLGIDFSNKIILDVGSSTGGFTDYALRHGARKVVAVDVGTDQLHPSLRGDPRIELHEQTDIRSITSSASASSGTEDRVLIEMPDIVVIDVSFISLREILPHISSIVNDKTIVIPMCKPQFEAGESYKHKGVIKNDRIRREILKDFELWLKRYYFIIDKADSDISGAKGNRERFYKLRLLVDR